MIILKRGSKDLHVPKVDDGIESIEDYASVDAKDGFEPTPEDADIENAPNSIDYKRRDFNQLKLRAETLIQRMVDLHRAEMGKEKPNYDRVEEVLVEVGGVEAMLEHLPLIANRTNALPEDDHNDIQDASGQLDMFERRLELFESEGGHAAVSDDYRAEVEAGFEPDIVTVPSESSPTVPKYRAVQPSLDHCAATLRALPPTVMRSRVR